MDATDAPTRGDDESGERDGDATSQRSRQTAERLYEAATSIMAESGWHSASSRKVAERAGVSLGVVHYHYASITELRARAAIRTIQRFFYDVALRVIDDPDPEHAIRELVSIFGEGDPHRPELSVLYQALVEAMFDDDLRREQFELVDGYRRVVTSYLNTRNVPHAASTAATITAAIDGFLIQRALDPDLSAEPIADGLVRLLRAP